MAAVCIARPLGLAYRRTSPASATASASRRACARPERPTNPPAPTPPGRPPRLRAPRLVELQLAAAEEEPAPLGRRLAVAREEDPSGGHPARTIGTTAWPAPTVT